MGKPSNEGNKGSKEDDVRRKISLIEAALYVSGRPLDLKTLGSIIGSRSKRKIRELARMLIKEYQKRNSSLEVLELDDQRFVLQLKAEYASKVRRLAVKPLLTDGPLRTLAYIAYRQPVPQKQVISARGTHAYKHIKQLLEMGLVKRKRSGRNKILRTTEYFADYFGLSHNPAVMKRQIVRILSGIGNKKRNDKAEKNK
ncbi:SMC-Scp complex subunit ScpB [Candidatus Bathyarchaeota archaeon]|nr:MAG: SMC-Scp complex subunit ScpB [Candidatus Bathyarchaeota archaeon]